jgi:hypothetical protein
MAGWCLILWGAVKVLHAVHLSATAGHQVGALSAILISLLFTCGAALLWLERAPWRAPAE